jgi:hypothetical protein
MSFHFTHVTLEFHWVRPIWFPCLWYIRRKPCTHLASRLTLSPNRRMVHLTRTVHLPCLEINTMSKLTKMSFHLTNITQKYHRVCLRRFPWMWYIWRKPCTYLASWLTLSLNRHKQASTWHTLHRSTIGCAKSDFHACGTFSTKRAPFLPRN